ncbi:MAG: hypothetical protein LBC19_04085 [Tannerella sp.]|nr:hypothetical protein [Tannerella sp.]
MEKSRIRHGKKQLSTDDNITTNVATIFALAKTSPIRRGTCLSETIRLFAGGAETETGSK